MDQFSRKTGAPLGVLLVCVLFAGASGAQTGQPGSRAATQDTLSKTETRLTKQQEAALLADIESTLKFVAADTKLELKRPVKGAFFSREQMRAELLKKFEQDESEKRMERSELVLKKFGLLDRSFRLRPFLLELLTEQIAGFYDDKTHTMTLLDWVPEDEQLPVMAHELTHALQDQRVGLTKFDDQEVPGIAKNVAEDNHHIREDEVDTARQAAVEGQAQTVFIDYALKGRSITIVDAPPQLVQAMTAGGADMTGSPVMERAPLLLQQALLFPYNEGLLFEYAVDKAKGPARAFGGVLDDPPSASSQILHPEQYLAHAPVPVMVLPDIHPLIDAAYEPYDVGVMGEVDVRMMAELFAGKPMALALAPAWNGGVYYAAQRKAVPAAERDSTASLALLYASQWKNGASARDFFALYDNNLPRKYDKLTRRPADEKDASERVYSTAEGDVLLTVNDTRVWVSEGFDLALARKLRDQVEGAQGVGPIQQARGVAPGTELTGGLSRWLGSFGTLKAGIPRVLEPCTR